MNPWFLVAAGFSFVLGVGHTVLGEWVGERILVRRLLTLALFAEKEKDDLAKRVVRLAWHATSIMWCGFGALFLYAALTELDDQGVVMLRIASLVFLCTGVLSLLTVPRKMLLFLVVSGSAWMGTC